jgi:hypothetical protein
MRWRIWGVLIAVATVLTAPPPAVGAMPEWLPLSEVRAGMRGIGRTVVRGTTVEAFDVEVVARVPGSGPAGDLILVRVAGPLVQRTGGIAAGMSGSPIYLKGRIAGAIGYGWPFSDHSLGLVTPIEDMMRVLPGLRGGRTRLPSPVSVAGRTFTDVAIATSPASAAAIALRESKTAVMVPLAQPLLVSGMSRRAVQFLRASLEPLGVTLVEGAAGLSTDDRPALVPGSAIGVQVLRGDLNAVALGTLTYRRGDAIVGFGHPFLNRGASAYLLTPAVIYGVVRSTAVPFKIGSAGAPVGMITEDRRAAIGGRLGVLPPMVVVHTVIRDRDRGKTVRMSTRVVSDRHLGPMFVLVSAMEAADRALDRIGEGTARVKLTLRGRGLERALIRENTFYHPRDIGTAAFLELPEALRLLFANEFVRTGPVDVAIDAEIEQVRQTAVIVEATVDVRRVRRGDVLPVKIVLRPFQGAASARTIEVVVPEEFPTGPATVLIRAGGRPVPEQGLAALLTVEPLEAPAASAAAQLATFSDRDRNTDLIVELIPGAARIPDGTGESAAQSVRVRTTTSWVVRGRIQVPVTVDPR